MVIASIEKMFKAFRMKDLVHLIILIRFWTKFRHQRNRYYEFCSELVIVMTEVCFAVEYNQLQFSVTYTVSLYTGFSESGFGKIYTHFPGKNYLIYNQPPGEATVWNYRNCSNCCPPCSLHS